MTDPVLKAMWQEVQQGLKHPDGVVTLDGAMLVPPPTTCIISWDDLTNGRCFYQCSQCRDGSVALSAMERLLRYEAQMHVVLLCPNCRQNWSDRPPLLYRSPVVVWPMMDVDDAIKEATDDPDIIFMGAFPATPTLPIISAAEVSLPIAHETTLATKQRPPPPAGVNPVVASSNSATLPLPQGHRRRLPLWCSKLRTPRQGAPIAARASASERIG